MTTTQSPSLSEIARTRGRVLRVEGNTIVFAPAQTNYQLHLVAPPGGYAGPMDEPIEAIIRAKPRKIWTVPSGGNFIAPIFGTPRIIQGWVLYGDERVLVLKAGANVIVEMSADDSAIDLTNGPLSTNRLVNAALLPGASFELPSH